MELIYIAMSIFFNIALTLFIFKYMKTALYKVQAGFMKNPVKINIITGAGKIICYLKNSKDDKVVINEKTFVLNDSCAVREGRIDNYYYNEDSVQPINLKQGESNLKPEYLTDLLLSAELHGSNSFITDLIKFKWILLASMVVAGGMLYLIYKFNDIQTTVNTIQSTLNVIKSSRVVG